MKETLPHNNAIVRILIAFNIKRRLFKELDDLTLSEKIHLRYFTLHIENISDAAEIVADLISIMAIKRSL